MVVNFLEELKLQSINMTQNKKEKAICNKVIVQNSWYAQTKYNPFLG
jgi:hypothetical protein